MLNARLPDQPLAYEGRTGTGTLPDAVRVVDAPVLPHAGAYVRWVKPALDRILAALALLVLLPIVVVIAAVVALALGRPVLFRQERVGRDGRRFEVLKFRSMEADRRRDHRSHAWDGIDRRITHKHPEDPRLNPVGRFIRRFSLDELPQLVNVLRGEMSLVGPRPELVAIVEGYAPWQHARHLVKPGLTGLWQVSERGEGEMHEHTATDMAYVDSVSLFTDMAILARTLPAMLGRQKGF